MSGNNIIRLNVDNSNITSRSKDVGFSIVNSKNFIDNSFDYEVYIEKCEIPIPKDLPLLVSSTPLRISLEATDKDDKDPIFGDELYVHYTLPREYRDLTEIITTINGVLANLSPSFGWAKFSTVDGLRLTLETFNKTRADKTKIWIDSVFYDLFNEIPRTGDGEKIQDGFFFELASKPDMESEYTQQESYVKDVFNLKAFRLYSSLPTESFWLYDQVKGTMVQSNLLGEIIYNTKEMTGNTNLLYIPTVFRYCSMTDGGEISKFNLTVSAYYFNGLEKPLTMDKNSYVSITLVFVRKFKI